MSLLIGIAAAIVVVALALAAAVAFIVVSLSRGARLIASRTGRGPIEAVVVRPCRPRPLRRQTIRFVQRRSVPLVAFGRGMLRTLFHAA
ncbi:hypothetical protein JQ557_18255 [Bradyrhizobium sp. U87765 SZCCT0131]|uniref:hypothetical protein n=1 Tax=unclassified Bradyrhizobium TaxID=2631580 RepID=UPI001BA879D2|nr:MULTISPECIES: hypothetical protein [unclassified Bradyrhizobium]MBR1219956.1 hypothetical protein [Bradyrhizobium sp. U87765 SZCCT0131]MBR1263588.1 hypothetical protein [Bradyrhizobium sp. U87765 SZCCT0134]MBR1309157.1 hypothetical protein [Bradyrhizobium sp. U87765 SZCCT0110]MBR1323920.1 hypothetical protein [Bradyrhizobium sp. U87765 SZCCT0109]MBR1349472.1 hypothetical protein [Bradyrhizobium sp. U87765 SZCCT0048]